MFKILHYTKIFSKSWRSIAPALLVTLLILVTHCVAHIRAESEYDSLDNIDFSIDPDSASLPDNDEPYEPALLQQEIESAERRQRMDLDPQTSTPPQHRRINNSLESNDNNTQDGSGKEEISLSEEYDENESATEKPTSATTIRTKEDSLAAAKSAALPTTLIPDYVRKGKAENFNEAKNEAINKSGSASDYIDDDENSYSQEYQHQQEQQQHRRIATYDFHENQSKEEDSAEPLAMKLYQSKKEKELRIGSNNLSVHEPIVVPSQKEHHSILHEQNLNSESGEDYYSDSVESASEHDASNQFYESVTTQKINIASVPTIAITTTTSTEPTTSATIKFPNIAIARAAFPGFPISFAPSINNNYNVENGQTTGSPYPLSTTSQTTSTTMATAATTTKPLAESEMPFSIQSRTFFSSMTGLNDPQSQSRSKSTISTTKTPILTSTTPFTTTITTPSISTSRPATKQGKQINISRRKLLPHEQLRNYIEDAYIRMPLAVIVDPSAESLEKTKTLWHDALRINLNIKIVLVSLNGSGAPAAYNFNNTRQFLAGLNSIKEHNGGNAFIGIVHASELVPYDSAVFISTATVPRQIDLVQDAAITLLKKRIRLYVIWYGDHATSENETQDAVGGILGEVAIRSGGEILHIVGSENSQELESPSTLTLVADAFIGSQEIDLPVDTTLSSLHVKIDAPMRSAILETPNGDVNLRKLVKFKSRVFAINENDNRLDAYVPLTKLRKSTVYKLKMIPEYSDYEYKVFIRAERKADQFLDDMIQRFDTFFLEGTSYYPTRFKNERLQSITAALAAATMPTHDNLMFPENEKTESNVVNDNETLPKNEIETFSDIEIHKNTIANGTFPTNQRSVDVLQKGYTEIEMGIHSQILISPGMMGQLYFEITNTRTDAIFHNIQVVDERRFLLRLVPQSIFLRPKETITVTVTVLVPSGTPQGVTDRVTLTCHGGETASLSLNLRVITTVDAQDTTPPTISWTFGNRCDNIAAEATNCAEKIWTLDVTAQDWQTGILRLQSTPSRLIHRNSYTVGSNEPLKATYIATCCEPKVSLIAYDIAGNQRSHNVDVRNIVLTDAAIAAIVLGALLLILLIVLLIAAIVWCCRRRKVVLDLPTYRSHSTRSME